MKLTSFFCPFCCGRLQSDTASNEEFSCIKCKAMVDILDADLTMVSLPPHDDIQFISTSRLSVPTVPVKRVERYAASH